MTTLFGDEMTDFCYETRDGKLMNILVPKSDVIILPQNPDGTLKNASMKPIHKKNFYTPGSICMFCHDSQKVFWAPRLKTKKK